MRRSEALAILSRDHHHALVVARTLRRADAETASAACERFLEFWEAEGRRHFQQEEEILFPAYAVHGDARHPLVLQALGDHVAIRARARELAAARAGAGFGAPPPVEAVHELGAALTAHVRLEERELFPVIEAAMPASQLLELARALEQS